jgi:hypothetical protein
MAKDTGRPKTILEHNEVRQHKSREPGFVFLLRLGGWMGGVGFLLFSMCSHFVPIGFLTCSLSSQ